MATTYKTFLNNDVGTTRTLLHEAIPLTGTIVSGTYVLDNGTETNVKDFSHGMFQSIYDYPYLSSSANQIVDITFGYSSDSSLSASNAEILAGTTQQNSKKINIYTQMAQVLVGHNSDGTVAPFRKGGVIVPGAVMGDSIGQPMDECFFLNYSRLLTKDEIKKGSYTIKLYTSGSTSGSLSGTLYGDFLGASSFKVNSPAGEFGIIYEGALDDDNSKSGDDGANDGTGEAVGLIYYQAGVVVLTASVFTGSNPNPGLSPTGTPTLFGAKSDAIAGKPLDWVLTGSTISASANAFRNRWESNTFNNTTELNSTIYFCRINHNDFNYSSNPSYTSDSKIRVKEQTIDQPISYITTVGLYSADNELLAVAKLSEPLKKTSDTDLTLRVRLDY
ncbi:hypothetical protein CL634_01440 [bacterium]|nr:hypothetical protein [bacterium]